MKISLKPRNPAITTTKRKKARNPPAKNFSHKTKDQPPYILRSISVPYLLPYHRHILNLSLLFIVTPLFTFFIARLFFWDSNYFSPVFLNLQWLKLIYLPLSFLFFSFLSFSFINIIAEEDGQELSNKLSELRGMMSNFYPFGTQNQYSSVDLVLSKAEFELEELLELDDFLPDLRRGKSSLLE